MSIKDKDSLLFWLEQEPVESDAEIYLPPDTPIQPQLSRISYQMNKKQELKKQRTIERLKFLHYEQLKDLREKFSKEHANPRRLPVSIHPVFLEAIPADIYLKENLDYIEKAIQDIIQMNSNKEDNNAIVPSLIVEEPKAPKLSEEELNKRKENEVFRQDYQKALEELFMDKEKECRNQYYTIVNLLLQNKESENLYAPLDPVSTPLTTSYTTTKRL